MQRIFICKDDSGKKALASEKLSKTDVQVLLEIVLFRRETMIEAAEQQGKTQEYLEEFDHEFRHNTKARKVLKGMLD